MPFLQFEKNDFLFCMFLFVKIFAWAERMQLYFTDHVRCNLLTVLPDCLVKGRGKLAVEHFTAISQCGDLQIRRVARFIDQ